MTYTPNQSTISLVKHFESLHDGDLKQIGLQPKMDPIGIWTEGYGRAMIDPVTKAHLRGSANKTKAYKFQTIFTEADAEKYLLEDLYRLGYIPASLALFPEYMVKLNGNQQGALCSFVYNCGTGKPKYKVFENIRKYLNGTMTRTALEEYWKVSVTKGGGKVLKGLVRRREAEVKLFFS